MAKKKNRNIKNDTLEQLVRRHDTKLSLDYQAINRLQEDCAGLTKNVGLLGKTVGVISGTVEVQSKVMNSILGITVIAFLGFMFKTTMATAPAQDPKVFAETVIRLISHEVGKQIPRAHATPSRKKSGEPKTK